MLDSIIFCSTLARRDSLHSLRCRCTLFLSRTPTFVNWALPANKPRVMCRLFIKNMLEKHTPIKEPVFYAQRGFGRKSRAAAPLLARSWRLLQALVPALGSSPAPSQGVAPPRRCWHRPVPTHTGGVCGARGLSCAASSIEMLGIAPAAWISSYD